MLIDGVWVVLQKGLRFLVSKQLQGNCRVGYEMRRICKEKKVSAPKEHSKGRLDIIGWNFVTYNSEQVRLRMW
nr:hypothetical protein [Tanacetum cinerariifolium]